MLKPDVCLSSILQVTPKLLTDIDVLALVLDVDNTIRKYKNAEVMEGVFSWVEEMKRSGILLMIASNNFKRSVSPIASKLGLPYISLSFKPFPVGLKKVVGMLNVKRENIAMIGDQFFTDVIGGKIQGFKTILVEPLLREKGFFWRIRRGLESFILHKVLVER